MEIAEFYNLVAGLAAFSWIVTRLSGRLVLDFGILHILHAGVQPQSLEESPHESGLINVYALQNRGKKLIVWIMGVMRGG